MLVKKLWNKINFNEKSKFQWLDYLVTFSNWNHWLVDIIRMSRVILQQTSKTSVEFRELSDMDALRIKAKINTWNLELKINGYILCDCGIGMLDVSRE